jgi:hypothetical protein
MPAHSEFRHVHVYGAIPHIALRSRATPSTHNLLSDPKHTGRTENHSFAIQPPKNMIKNLSLSILSVLVLTGTTSSVHAQIGAGWMQISPSTHVVIGSSGSGYYKNYSGTSTSITDGGGRYTYSNGIRKFELLDTSRNRVEYVYDDIYTTRRQFQGEFRVSSPSTEETFFQTFTDDPHGPYLLLIENNTNGGTMRVGGSGATYKPTLATGIYGVWVRVNTIHDEAADLTQVYINGTKKFEQGWGPGISYYDKFGCYGSLTTSSAKIEVRYDKYFKEGPTAKDQVYQGCNYSGWTVSLGTGDYTLTELRNMGFVNDDASSIKVPSGYHVTVYTSDNYTGTAVTFTADESCFTDLGINDAVSSIKVTFN